MAKHAYVAYRLTVSKLRQPEDLLDVGNIDGRGAALLPLFHGFLRDVENSALRDNRFGRYLNVANLAPEGNTVRFEAHHGRFGTTGQLVDTLSGVTTHEFNEDESPVSVTRNILASPPEGTWAIFIAERYGGRGASSMVLSQFKRAFRRRFEGDEIILKHEGLMDSDAWAKFVKDADMTAIEIKRFGPSSDIGDPVTEKTIGKITTTVKPGWGEGRFSRRFRDSILGGEKSPQEMIGIPAFDTDEVEAILDDGNQQRRLLVGKSMVPVLSYPIGEDSDQRPGDAEVYRAMGSKVSEVNGKLGLKLPREWKVGRWSDEDRAVKLDAVRDS